MASSIHRGFAPGVFAIAGDPTRETAISDVSSDARVRLNTKSSEPVVATVSQLYYYDASLLVRDPIATRPALRLSATDVASADVEVTSPGKTVALVLIGVTLVGLVAGAVALSQLDLGFGGFGGFDSGGGPSPISW